MKQSVAPTNLPFQASSAPFLANVWLKEGLLGLGEKQNWSGLHHTTPAYYVLMMSWATPRSFIGNVLKHFRLMLRLKGRTPPLSSIWWGVPKWEPSNIRCPRLRPLPNNLSQCISSIKEVRTFFDIIGNELRCPSKRGDWVSFTLQWNTVIVRWRQLLLEMDYFPPILAWSGVLCVVCLPLALFTVC